ncbi:MAG: hypothetical protein K8U57_34810 [Planctomycetes bacterium]|nr:hypothetical protein [Planctomycetota bacterium]
MPPLSESHFNIITAAEFVMRDALRALGLFLGIIVLSLGCAKDKYNMRPESKELYTDVPNESRYNDPDKAGYRKPLAPGKEEKAAIGRPTAGNGNPGGF